MKRVIITGVSGSLGSEVAKLFIKKGFAVIGISRTKPNLKIEHIKTDLKKEDDIKKAIRIIKAKYPEFECLVNCAGVISIRPTDDLDFKEIEDLFKVNVIAPMILTSGLLDTIKENEADIVNVGSSIGFKAYEQQCAYGSSKWALRGLTKNLQQELVKYKSRVIGFHPGGFKSKLFEKATEKKMDLTGFMDPKYLARLMIQMLEAPKNMQVTEVMIQRK